MIAFERGEFYWIFNFHPTQSYPDFRVGVTSPGKYVIVLDTDSAEFGGHSRVQKDTAFFTDPKPWDDRPNSMLVRHPPSLACEHCLPLTPLGMPQIYAPCRAALVLQRVE